MKSREVGFKRLRLPLHRAVSHHLSEQRFFRCGSDERRRSTCIHGSVKHNAHTRADAKQKYTYDTHWAEPAEVLKTLPEVSHDHAETPPR